MKTLILITGFTLFSTAFAADLQNCTLSKDGVVVTEIAAFDILNFETSEPEATIDGNLMNYEQNKKVTKMGFSNECDNSYELEFKTKDIAKAVAGKIKTITAKAIIAQASDENIEVVGIVTCDVK